MTSSKNNILEASPDQLDQGFLIVRHSGALGGTLTPGIYEITSTLLIDQDDLTLDAQGDPDASWLFYVPYGIETQGNVLLTGGAQAKNVNWLTDLHVNIGPGTCFIGNIQSTFRHPEEKRGKFINRY